MVSDRKLDIRDRFTLIIDSSTPEEVEAFFGPLFAHRHLRGMPRLSRHSVNRASTHTLQALASDLDQIVGDLSAYFSVLFVSLRDNEAGRQSQDVVLALFDLWCEKSLIVIPRQAAEQLTRSNGGGQTTTEITKALAEMGFAGESAAQAAEGIAGLSPQQRKRPETVAEALWPAYETAVLSLSVQAAHVFLGRALLYRIGEDQANFRENLPGEVMEAELAAVPSPVIERQWPATEMLSSVRLSMQSFLHAVYQLGEFSW